jgi:hypothetical protein
MYVADVPYSPPVAKPCSRRQRTSMTTAADPMDAAVGVSAMSRDEPAMSEMLNTSAGRRPCRSAYRPKNHDPIGRITKVIAKMPIV